MDRAHRYQIRRRLSVLSLLAFAGLACSYATASVASVDLATVPLFDGKRGDLLNTWGGSWSVGQTQGIRLLLRDMPSGGRAVCMELGPLKAKESRFLQCFASGFGRTREYYQTRDITRYERLRFHVQNETGTALHGKLQLKDYRDAAEHSASYRFELGAGAGRTCIEIPLASLSHADERWTVAGDPDMSRIVTIDFLFQAQDAVPAGRISVDEVVLTERGGPLDVMTSPLTQLVERLARRQWDALWMARSRDNGMIPNNSYQSTDAGLNTTAATLWMLPAATRRQWVDQRTANHYVETVLRTLGQLLDRSKYVPPRYVDWVTLKPSLFPEESSVDAAFLALALHQYKSLPSTPAALRTAIEQTQNRFDFAPFACAGGWRMAYQYATHYGPEGFGSCTYDGYTNEGNLTSLAAHLSPRNSVPIERHWNSSANRLRIGLVGVNSAPIVHSMKEFRPPFTQALWNLFVDVRQRGPDCYPDGSLAVNPWQNFVCYEQNVMAKLAALGRPLLVQPDAGDDGTLGCYRQFSVYDDFGQSDLFMPWSVSIALLAGVDRAEASLRFLLQHRQLCGPLGLADSAKWATGAAEPYAVTARHDFWNTSLATMAMLEWLDGESRQSRSFAALPEIRSALDRVFPKTPPARATPAILTGQVETR